jgi:hypothetical protein
MASSSLQPLLSYLSSLEARIAALEGKPGSVSAPAALSAPAAATMDDEVSKQTAAFDEFLATGAPATLAAVSAKIGGDAAVLVSG